MANTLEHIKPVFNQQLEDLLVERMDGNEEIFVRLMNDEEFRQAASAYFDADGVLAGEGGRMMLMTVPGGWIPSATGGMRGLSLANTL